MVLEAVHLGVASAVHREVAPGVDLGVGQEAVVAEC